jgi:hypothetical protein
MRKKFSPYTFLAQERGKKMLNYFEEKIIFSFF